MTETRPATDPPEERVAPFHYNARGQQCFTWTLTDCDITDPVQLRIGPDLILPVIFIPGVMGSNLKSVPEPDSDKTRSVWRLDYGFAGIPTPLLGQWASQKAGIRQSLLHPDRVQVDDEGGVPNVPWGMVQDDQQLLPAQRKTALMRRYCERGWGEVGQTSYERFLIWLEHVLNSPTVPRHLNYALELEDRHWEDPTAAYRRLKAGMDVFMPRLNGADRNGDEDDGTKPLTTDDLLAGVRFNMPVHAFGYNWLASNTDSAKKLKQRIETLLEQYGSRCKQVLLVTHSMGGLIARMCATLPGMESAICGIVHGVMPTNGAPVAYRRCKVGMRDESFGTSLVIGSNGQEVTAVFAQSPGALQLLPTTRYAPGWLKLLRENQSRTLSAMPALDQCPYDAIYLERHRWWGLVKEEWLAPKGGTAIEWTLYERAIKFAREFHAELDTYFHPNTYVFYGSDAKYPSFETIRWNIRPGLRAAGTAQAAAPIESIFNARHTDVQHDGRTIIHVRSRSALNNASPSYVDGTSTPGKPTYSNWEIHCAMQDGVGDGTVPTSSGRAPIDQAERGEVREQLKMQGFDHEGPFRMEQVQLVTLQWILKIAAQAKKPS
ncbi:alpha/beta hydrolase [Achromobacter spanius]|uniref:Alpha/beta hydrolase n=1 Tax=Achromobacter spanius TaxID=217203 RepID=A0A2S5GI86_9BURK|nr:alpha/beta hydrolase [Achromobacter spanius]PPA72767.1 alpha/beta hydrolase [Achromobacter spanius]